MSEMMKNKGVIKELYSEIENPEEKIIQLHFDTNIPFDELVGFYNDEPDWDWVEHDDYSMIIDRLFDVSGAPDSYDDDGERYDVRPIGGNLYEVDLYYYNGGTSMEELIGDYLLKEEEDEVKQSSVFYAVKIDDLYFLPATGRAQAETPRLFATELEAKMTMSNEYSNIPEDQYKVVPLREA